MNNQIDKKIKRMKFLRSQSQKLEVLMAHISTQIEETSALAHELEQEICSQLGDTIVTTSFGLASSRVEKFAKLTDANKLPECAMRQSISAVPNMKYINHVLKSGETVPGAKLEEIKKVVFR